MSNFHFRLMAVFLKLRDLFLPPRIIVKEAGIKQGSVVLDFGCGPGGFAIAAAEMAGSDGRVYALDVHPLAVKMTEKAAARKGLRNIETIRSDCATGLEDKSVDVILLYDTFHILSDRRAVLEKLYRVLKDDGTLSFSDHHIKENEIISEITSGGMFRLLQKGKRTYSFAKEGVQQSAL
jgi:ubiquinone/menaquinone biosynthesis C-methylase UbiE